eukprot:CAMPEP_0194357166 /NCGR_PEP_ID=MMETSP0174-20130528/4680_1 /TAXON_ID=216777 /ORGANISM="Proboscia alata, Strain PI-D3" /LENGTH=713 /DNA_ID=CAMNT_0039127071 /DNA_START=171 /DNA_END=2312 /DNA_ORIENTATION=+
MACNSPDNKKAKISTSPATVPGAELRNDDTSLSYQGTPLELKCINTIRALCADMVQKAQSGHPGAPMGCAPMAHLLWTEIMAYSPKKHDWWNRDRFVLSNGHACALQYAMLHLTGYEDMGMDQLKQFRQIGSKAPGHPENFVTKGVEVCTGPLGQGLSNAVGLAMAQSHLNATTQNKEIFTNYTYVICGDGCLQEGVTSEASSLAGHLGLGNLIVLYDDNQITIDGSTDLSFTENVAMRYESYGWQVFKVEDVSNGLEELREAIQKAKSETSKPTLIQINTVIGYGSAKAGTAKTHGAPLGDEDLAATKKSYNLDPEKSFQVDDDVREIYTAAASRGEKAREEWEATFASYKATHAEEATALEQRFVPPATKQVLTFPECDKAMATRKYSELCLNAIAPQIPSLIGGSADLTGSNLTNLKCSGDYQSSTPGGRYIRFGVREHAMSAICNGLFAFSSGNDGSLLRPFCATFLTFAGYALGAMRLSALSKFGVLYIMTHDSIGLGEDGPTHQPIETLENLRSIPNINVWRPADYEETKASYVSAVDNLTTPTVICASRSTLKLLTGKSCMEKAQKGGYVLQDVEKPQLILIGTGSEIGLCVDAANELSSRSSNPIRTRVVSMPCQELFLSQEQSYQSSVLLGGIPTLSVEASAQHGWHRFSNYQICMSSFGASGPGGEVMKLFGFTVENVTEKGEKLVKFYEGKTVPNLMDRPIF